MVKLFDKVISCGKMMEDKKDKVLLFIMLLMDYVLFEGVDLIVEVVFED